MGEQSWTGQLVGLTLNRDTIYRCKMTSLGQHEYEALLSFRTGLRRFRKWSEAQAAMVGLTPARHQLLLAVRGHHDPAGPTVGDIARYLLIRSHSAVELIDRAVAEGLVERGQDSRDSRAVRLHLTAEGDDRLGRLAELHLEELRRVVPQLEVLWEGLDPHGHSRATFRRSDAARVGDQRG